MPTAFIDGGGARPARGRRPGGQTAVLALDARGGVRSGDAEGGVPRKPPFPASPTSDLRLGAVVAVYARQLRAAAAARVTPTAAAARARPTAEAAATVTPRAAAGATPTVAATATPTVADVKMVGEGGNRFGARRRTAPSARRARPRARGGGAGCDVAFGGVEEAAAGGGGFRRRRGRRRRRRRGPPCAW